MGIWSYEVITEDGARYRRNRRHLTKTAEYYDRRTLARNLNLTASPSKQAEEAVAVPVASPSKQAEEAVAVPAVSEQTSRSSESLSQVISQWQCLSSQERHAQAEL